MKESFSNNKGIRARKNKQGKITSWAITIYVGIENGERQYAYTSIQHNPKWTEEQGREEAYKAKIIYEDDIKHKRVTISQTQFNLFAEEWLRQKELFDKLKPNTLNLYRACIDNCNTVFGKMKLKDITYSLIKAFYLDLMSGKITGKNISARTVRSYHTVLVQLLDEACKQGIVIRNEASLMNNRLPKLQQKHPSTITTEQYNVIREAIKQNIKWYTFFVLDAETGLRRGELCGLKWSSIDFKNKTLTVENNIQRDWKKGELYECSPKTETSNQTIILFDSTINVLKQYKAWQNQERLRLGEKYIDNGFVFTGRNGNPMHPNTVNSYITRQRAKIGTYFTTHDFRRYHGSVLASAEVPLQTIAKRMRHSKASTTLDYYIVPFSKDDKLCEEAYNRAVNTTQKEISNNA